ncbi:MAG: hypothetical protein EKK40_16325 [Bradyrhizobiaceae bacterium]|nr:MAG: hypothetical protein EKK40_16325 [Bradyrhizobiaceae bacterium]
MPRYFFNTRIGDEVIADPAGADLRDPDQAWEMARAIIMDLLKAAPGEAAANPLLMTASLEVTDSSGTIVLEFPFSEALIDLATPPTTH